MNDLIHGDHLGHFPGFLQKHFPACMPCLAGGIGFVPLQGKGHFRITGNAGGGEIFFDRHFSGQCKIPADIGDAKATLSQDAAKQVFSVQDGTGLKRVACVCLLPGVIPAAGAGSSGKLLHAAKTEIYFHLRSSFFCLYKISRGRPCRPGAAAHCRSAEGRYRRQPESARFPSNAPGYAHKPPQRE